MGQAAREEDVGQGDLKRSEKKQNGERAGREGQIPSDERQDGERAEHVAPGHSGLGRARFAAQGKNQRSKKNAGDQSHDVAGHAAALETADEEERHAAEGDGDGDGVTGAHRLANDDGGEEEHPDGPCVLQEDRIGRSRPLGGHDERGQTGGVAENGRGEGRCRRPDAPGPHLARQEDHQRDRREQRAVEGDFQRRIGNAFDADAAGRPQQRRGDDEQNAFAARVHAQV